MPRLQGVNFHERFNAYDRFTIGGPSNPGGFPALNRTVDSDLELGVNEIRLFGNRNIGMYHRTNLQVPATIAFDDTTWIEHWYARTDLLHEALSTRQKADLFAFASSAIVTLCIGDRPRSGWQRPLSELLADRPWVPASVLEDELTPERLAEMRAAYTKRAEEGVVPVWLPVRQSCSVQVGGFDHEAFDRFIESMDGRKVQIWLHLEGVRTRYAG